MNIKVNFKNQGLTKSNANLILFADEKFNITGLKKHISNSEYSYTVSYTHLTLPTNREV